ncbi:capsular polysaccharide export protein [Desulfobaculum bizertense DSM 18034]|uniref:Capsular polysaccharide export protein n=2 Tax=Desulfobaculum TaxID=1433996 RepID=A0A1T4W0D4_9BACT|nr:capsular polysaccharide export protein [Desulfobaculum bizertense DSM 18034]
MGSFFHRFQKKLKKKGITTYNICFNGGDWLFNHSTNCIPYTAPKAQWGNFFLSVCAKKSIDAVILFGDCRYYQKEAVTLCKRGNIHVYVFEEGYIRPNFVTFEDYGVNGNSLLPKSADFYSKLPKSYSTKKNYPSENKKVFWMGLEATLYYIAMSIGVFYFPFYEHHRNKKLLPELKIAIKSLLMKYSVKNNDAKIEDYIRKKLKKKYFLIPLQTHNDFQIRAHSKFETIERFIDYVMHSFARYAPPQFSLIFKHHPVDRGRKNYTSYINTLSQKYNIKDRVFVTHDIHLPLAIKNAKGVIIINSTVGLSSLYHGTPTKTLGKAIYDIAGLTAHNVPLRQFWTQQPTPNRKLYLKFRNYLIEKTQLNGSFWGNFPSGLNFNTSNTYQPLNHQRRGLHKIHSNESSF